MPVKLPKPSLLKTSAILFAAFFMISAAGAQNKKTNYTLLWRISGKDLTEPSYLFGTMHVRDKRVFHFSDSVMLAIRKCKGFALEVHPDSIIKKLFAVLQTNDTTNDLHKILDQKQYEQLSKKFEQKKGYKMRDNINPLMAEAVLERPNDKPGDKATFIDAYLYGIARTMDKKIYGLENASEQFDKMLNAHGALRERLLSLLETDADYNTEEMIRIYSSGDLAGLSGYDEGRFLNDSVLIARNNVMVNSMLTDMHTGPLFTAVGAAHLPGDNGIISLLKKQGYTVVPVAATFTSVADKFHVDNNGMKWVNHTEYDKGYSLDFPGEPILANIYAGQPVLIYPDLANETFYGISVMPKGSRADPADREKVVGNVIGNFLKNKKNHLISRKNIMINGLLCTDVVLHTTDGYQRLALFLNNNTLYYVYTGNHLSSIYSAGTERFFRSFKSFPVKEKPSAPWIDYKNDTAAFVIKFPQKPKPTTKVVPREDPTAPYVINLLLSTDTDNLNNYLVRYNDYPAGTFISEQDSIFSALINNFAEKGATVNKIIKITKDGHDGREVNMVQNHYHSVMRLYTRGNRIYMLLKQNVHEDEEVDTHDIFFDSFAFTSYIHPSFVAVQPLGANYQIKMPGAARLADSSNNRNSYLQNSILYMSTSPASGGVYTFQHSRISKYYRTKSVDTLYNYLAHRLAKYSDTLIRIDTVTMDGKRALEVITQKLDTKKLKRVRLLIDGNDVFYLESYLAKGEEFGNESNTFYNSFSRTGPLAPSDILSSKADAIMNGLRSTDTSEYKNALGALNYYDFEAGELPAVYTALHRTYTDDTTATGARAKLIRVLKNVHDENTTTQLQSVYRGLDDNDILKSETLSVLPVEDPKKGYDIYLDLLTHTKPLKVANNYTTFQPLQDSLQYAAEHFKQIIPMMADSGYRIQILSVIDRMKDNSSKYGKLIKDNFVQITAYAYDELKRYITSKDTDKSEWQANCYKYLYLMDSIKNEPFIGKYTSYYLKYNPKGSYINYAATARIYNGLALNPALVTKLLDSMDTRFEMMEAYAGQNQLYKVPGKYKTQSQFGKLCLYKEITASGDDDDDSGLPEKIILLGSVMDKGAVYYTYQFRQPGRDAKKVYIGIAGPYKPGSAKLDFSKYFAYTSFDEKTANWTKQAKAMIPKLRDSYQLK